MTHHSDRLWIHVVGEEGERLYRAEAKSRKKVIHVPSVGTLNYGFLTEDISQRSQQIGNMLVTLFCEGEVVSRHEASGAIRGARRRSSRVAGNAFLACAVLFSLVRVGNLWRSGNVRAAETQVASVSLPPAKVPIPQPSPVAPSKPQPVQKEADPSLPVPTERAQVQKTSKVVPRPVKTPPARSKAKKNKKKRKPRSIPKASLPDLASEQWKSQERKARKAFLHGDWSTAEEFISEIEERNGGRSPRAIKDFAAEVSYAQCQRFYTQEAWAEARKSCGKAVWRNRHPKATAILRELEERARRLFLEGYVMEKANPEAAIRRYKEVLAMAPRRSPYRKKAKRKLKAFRQVRAN